ncbi:uncharacterized protein LOC123684171 [Harmonia axyridis]|uniref:uncharacterized protein LOC123684171 n=1 Tax=Harmonia axyridis TaxID=115357 RepID=UPI001E2777EF|nr:uncharacterized protein LOC123684171 [Harmonia axyridis]
MGHKKCFLCGETRKLREISYHRLPTDLEMRNLWLKSLNVEDKVIESFKTQPVLCSKHFQSQDIMFAGGRRVLHMNAIPVLFSASSVKIESPNEVMLSSFPTMYETEHAEIIQSTSPHYVSHHDQGIQDIESQKRRYSSEMENNSNPSAPVSPQQSKNFRYVGDFTQNDIEDPILRKKFWIICRNTFKTQKMRIRSLQKKINRVNLKINSLEALTRQLKQDLISRVQTTH